jgi:hypothetical protein
MTQLLSPTGFKWFLTLITGIVAGGWFVYDAINLMRLRADDPKRGDKRFGYLMGMTIGVIGVLGCLKFWNVV